MGLQMQGDDEADVHNDHKRDFHPWPLSLQWIVSLALVQSLLGHYFSLLQLQRGLHWRDIVVFNVGNGLVFLILAGLVIAAFTFNSASARFGLTIFIVVFF